MLGGSAVTGVRRWGRGWRAAAVGAGLAVLAGACSSGDQVASPAGSRCAAQPATAEARAGRVVTFGADQEPANFNPNTPEGASLAVNNVIARVLPSVFLVDPGYKPVLDDVLMDGVEVTSTDPQTVVYRVNPAAVWSDGTPIGFADFDYLWRMSKGDGLDVDGSPAEVAATAGYEDIASLSGSEDGKTVTAVFSSPYADWKSLFSLALVPSHVVSRAGWNSGMSGFDPAVVLSGGPFRIDSYRPGQDLTLVRNETYWGPPARLDRIVFRFIPESGEQIPALCNAEVDLIYPQPQLDALTRLRAIDGVATEVDVGLSYEHLTLNVENEFLADARVRRALALALDRDQIVERTVGQVDPDIAPLGNRIYVATQPEYEDHSGPYQRQDLAGARDLLEEAGFTAGPDGLYAKDGRPLRLRLSTTAGNALREQQGVLIQAQLEQAGIDIRIDNATPMVLQRERLPQGDFDIANFGWTSSPYPSGFADIFGTGKAANFGRYSDAQVDALFAQAERALDETAKAGLYNEIDRRLWEDMASIPLYQKPTLVAYREAFANIGDNATVFGIFWNAETWGPPA